MMGRWMVVALAFMAACAPDVPPAVGVSQSGVMLRDASAPIASQTDVTASRMAGDWAIRAKFPDGAGPWGGMSLEVLPNEALQWAIPTGGCRSDGACFSSETLVLLEPVGPGRWRAQDSATAGFESEIWVLWMDFDSRTAVIGTPSGEFGWIMDKSTTGGADRLVAARDIMDWFGYNTANLQRAVR